ncbi:hypothetical protein ACFE04_008261 [Oxalis oulophora]
MALLYPSSSSPPLNYLLQRLNYNNNNNIKPTFSKVPRLPLVTTASHVCSPRLDKSSLLFAETTSENELWAAACLRVRSFYNLSPSTYRVQDHKKYLAEREFQALKERIAGKRIGFGRVSCVNATLPLLNLPHHAADDLSAECKFTEKGEDRVVVGSLDINQCLKLPDEISGNKPEGIGADFARAYLSNVCVASELQRQGLGYQLIEKSKMVAQEWGISDLYVHVAIDNEPAKKLYMKSGFIYENDEPARQARFLDRPRRILMWIDIPGNHVL